MSTEKTPASKASEKILTLFYNSDHGISNNETAKIIEDEFLSDKFYRKPNGIALAGFELPNGKEVWLTLSDEYPVQPNLDNEELLYKIKEMILEPLFNAGILHKP